MVLDANNNPIDELDTDAGGNFLGHLPAGINTYEVLADDRLTTTAASIAIMPGVQTGALVQMAAPATIAVTALDELSRRAPVKIQLIGHNPQIEGGGDADRRPQHSLFARARRARADHGVRRHRSLRRERVVDQQRHRAGDRAAGHLRPRGQPRPRVRDLDAIDHGQSRAARDRRGPAPAQLRYARAGSPAISTSTPSRRPTPGCRSFNGSTAAPPRASRSRSRPITTSSPTTAR